MRGEIELICKILNGDDAIMAKRVKKLLSIKGPPDKAELRRLVKFAKTHKKTAQQQH
jgi:hypothetical protein